MKYVNWHRNYLRGMRGMDIALTINQYTLLENNISEIKEDLRGQLFSIE